MEQVIVTSMTPLISKKSGKQYWKVSFQDGRTANVWNASLANRITTGPLNVTLEDSQYGTTITFLSSVNGVPNVATSVATVPSNGNGAYKKPPSSYETARNNGMTRGNAFKGAVEIVSALIAKDRVLDTNDAVELTKNLCDQFTEYLLGTAENVKEQVVL